MDHPCLAIDYGFLKANNPDVQADQGATRSSQERRRSTDSPGDGSSRKVECTTMECEACRGLVGWLGQPNSHLEVRQRPNHPPVSPRESEVEKRRQDHHFRAPASKQKSENAPPYHELKVRKI